MTDKSIVTEIREFIRYCEQDCNRRPALLRLEPETYGKLREESRELLKWDSDAKQKMFDGIPIEVGYCSGQPFIGEM